MSILELQNIHKSFRHGFFGRRTDVLRGLDLSIDEGEVYGLLGHNGAGKSTTMKVALGLLRPARGRVRLFGHGDTGPKTRARVGYLSEEIGLYPYLNAVEMLRLVGELFRTPRRRISARIEELLDAVGLSETRHLKIRHYSKGMRQRLGVATAIFNNPELLVLDEPYSGLDPVGRRELRRLLLGLKQQGTTTLLSSHIVPDVEAVCDRVGILSGGRLARVLDLREVYADRANDLEAVLSGVPPGALDARDYGGQEVHHDETVRIIRCAGDRRFQSLVSDVYAAGGRVVGVRQVRMNLEDIFMDAVAAAGDAAVHTDRVKPERLVPAQKG